MVYLLAAFCCAAMVLYVFITRVYRDAGELRKPIIRLLCLAIYVVILQGIFVFCTNRTVATFVIGLYFAGIDWLLIEMLCYIEAYTQLVRISSVVKHIVRFLAVVDAVNMMINVRFNHVFWLYSRPLYDGYSGWGVDRTSVWFQIHLIFAYSLVLSCVIFLLNKAFRTSSFYRAKYLTVLEMFIAVVVVNAVSMLTDSPYDISVFLYCALVIQVCYYSLFYKPKELINRTLALVVNDIKDVVLCFDDAVKCVYTNKMAIEYFGEMTSEKVGELTSKLEAKIRKYRLEGTESFRYEASIPIGERNVLFAVNYNRLVDKKGSYIGCFFTMHDRTEELEKFREEHYRITIDQLTGVYNRQYFFERAEQLIKTNQDTEYLMVCSDIKGFKLYNDLFGTDQGDRVLVYLAALLKQHATSRMVYGRISADEFALVMPKDRYREEFFLEMIGMIRGRFSSKRYQMHINVGVYEICDRTEPIFSMCDKAKLVIEEYRSDYSAVVSYFDDKLLEQSLYGRKLVSEFDRALENHEFCMYLQPQFTADGKVLGAEALVRWQHPERGLLSPGQFVDVFEQAGLIHRLDRYIRELAVAKLEEWKNRGREDLYISVNISAKNFYYLDLYEELTGLVEKYGIKPESLKLEITETVMMREMRKHSEPMEKLRRYGFQVEIDDFGSGYSSLNMLKSIDVDVVKIDMCFLDRTERIERGTKILSTIIALLKHLDMGVITEGVETKEQLEALKDMGCNLFQGYFFDRPIPVDEFERKYM